MAHDEEHTIAAVLDAILSQALSSAVLTSVFVVSSGSRDATDDLVRQVAACDPRVRLVREPYRRGKVAAVNVFLATARADVYALCNADVVLQPGALEALLLPLQDARVGMTGARIDPRVRTGPDRGFFDFANSVLWAIHHQIVLQQPKMGEAVAFRPLVDRIPEGMIADEAFLEAAAHLQGLEVRYVPDARAIAGCPLSLLDYFSVRRRNTCAHALLERRLGYAVTTLRAGPILRALGRLAADRWRRRGPDLRDLRDGCWLFGVVGLEVLARACGALDARLGPGRHVAWRMARSARRPIDAGSGTESGVHRLDHSADGGIGHSRPGREP